MTSLPEIVGPERAEEDLRNALAILAVAERVNGEGDSDGIWLRGVSPMRRSVACCSS